VEYEQSYKLRMNIVYKSTITNMATAQNFEVMSN